MNGVSDAGAPPSPLTLYPGCKVNLFLRIVSRRDDGYHELETLFLHLQHPSDRLTLTLLPPEQKDCGLRFTCSDAALASEDNLVVKAWRLYAEASGFTPNMLAHLDKRTPVGAGIGGGSADAAAMLLALEEMAACSAQALGQARLAELALILGADVPFFLRKTPCLATGVGEQLQKARGVLPLLQGTSLVLCCPKISVSTGWAYGAWDEAHGFTHHAKAGGAASASSPNPAGARDCGGVDRLTEQKSVGIDTSCLEGLRLYNSFEAVVFKAHGGLRFLKEELLRLGAAGALLSGSGASLFGIFRSRRQALEAVEHLRALDVSAHMHDF